MIVVDTSAWVEYLRQTETPVHVRLDELLEEHPSEIAVAEVVVGELLAGAPSSATATLRDRLRAFRMLRLHGLHDFELAASFVRTCREHGEAVRQLIDCLVAVVAIRAGATLLHADRDFEKLARHTRLRLEPVG